MFLAVTPYAHYAYDMFPEQIPWGVTITTIIATVVLSTIGLGYLLLGWTRKRSWRVLLRGAGFVL
ncbi:MAG: hypothetical protein LBH11_00190, partial [Propionibacteriaceae bacterium]|nr:hypothetical protein [Propionibacteriaceae bacterium]